MKKTIIIFSFLFSWVLANAQRNCGTDLYNKDIIKEYPELTGRYGVTNTDKLLNEKLSKLTGVINIPVAVHVLYGNHDENISDQEINAQINQLNLDYNAGNSDLKNVPREFKNRVANCRFHFELKKIIHKETAKSPFFISLLYDKNGVKVYNPNYEPIKFSDLGGDDGLPCTEYLNIWVGNISDGSNSQLLGYAAFPGGICNYDGVVIYYKSLGFKNAEFPFNKGRTLTHEVGHWLNLRHIGGDKKGGCGNDLVADTPPQKGGSIANQSGNDSGQNFGDPTHPLSYDGECNGTKAEMFMNFMDYVNDSSMYMFTINQKDRMRSLFVEGGKRASYISNNIQKASFTEAGNRKSSYTPVILKSVKYFYSRFGTLYWKDDKDVASYKVSVKQVRSNTWMDTTTTKSSIKIEGLSEKIIYEAKVQATLKNGTVTTPSPSYLFIIKGYNPVKSKKFRFVL